VLAEIKEKDGDIHTCEVLKEIRLQLKQKSAVE
jgi:hypothetical protein